MGGSEESYRGLLDEVSLFDRPLSAEEIAEIYEAGTVGKCKAPTLSCYGFEPPMASGPVSVKGNRALPFKA